MHVFDSNSFGVLRNYFPDRFPTFWDLFDRSVAAGEIISVREVERELEVHEPSEWILERLKPHKGFFSVPENAETTFVARIFGEKHFQALVGEKERLAGKPVADPFLIARAKVREGCVVTEEKFKPNAAKIPNVCRHFRVDCTNVEGFLKAKGWRF
jgi:hypothetical protein